ncbi:MAG: S-methyl-5'-thioadenosine phosphorylase [Parvularculaceae bacterium]
MGVVGGSGRYAIEGLEDLREETIDTPRGAPSGPIAFGRIGGVEARVIARHGPAHAIPPSHVNYRANVDAMKRAGATDIISISACGSLREDLAPGDFVIVDQFIDRTSGREASFFGPGCVAHVSMARPICPTLADAAFNACEAAGARVKRGGAYICINGPQFSSKAESALYRQWGAAVIGMTNATEAKLAREAELPYATIAMVTDYDCWRDADAEVDVAAVLEVMRANTEVAKRAIPRIATELSAIRTLSPLGVETCLDVAIITPPHARDPEMLAKLDAVAARVLHAQ